LTCPAVLALIYSAQKKPVRCEQMTNEDLQRLIESRTTSGYVSMLHPLEIDMARDELERLTRASMDEIRSRPVGPVETELLQQRIDFLGWLAAQPDQVRMAVYPADLIDDMDDLEDIQELLDDGDQLPF
jgi:hypothetical protein